MRVTQGEWQPAVQPRVSALGRWRRGDMLINLIKLCQAWQVQDWDFTHVAPERITQSSGSVCGTPRPFPLSSRCRIRHSQINSVFKKKNTTTNLATSWMSGNCKFKTARGNAWMERTVDLALAVAAKRGERSLKSTDAEAREESVAAQPTVSADRSQSSTFWHPRPLCRTDFYSNGILSQRVDWHNNCRLCGHPYHSFRDTDF